MKSTLVAAAIAAALSVTAAEAATVSPTSEVTFAFDLSSYGEVTFGRSGYNCYVECSDYSSPLRLLQGASLAVNFGSSAGASDLGSNSFTNIFYTDINNVSGYFVTSTPITVDASVDTLYATFVYVDDSFGVEEFWLADTQAGYELQGSLLPVPLPATLPLLLAGLGGIAVFRRRGA